MKKSKIPISILLSLLMVISLFSIVPFTASAAICEDINYIDADGSEKTLERAELVTESMDDEVGFFTSAYSWLYVIDDITLTRAICNDDTDLNIILGDNATLTVTGLMNIKYASLNIYCQSGGTGKLVIDGKIGTGAILAVPNKKSVTINGGIVEVKNASFDAFGSGKLVMNGGTATFTGSPFPQRSAVYADVAFNGGNLTATSSSYGIYKSTTLNYKNATDRITSKNYNGKVTVADGKVFTDGSGNYYAGILTDEERKAIAGKTLQPAPNAHFVTIDSSLANGALTTDKKATVSGQTVTVTVDPTVAPKSGYIVGGVTVNGTAATKADDTHYTFSMPDSDAAVTAVLTPDPACFSQDGDVYTIHNENGWDVFCDLLAENTKGYFDGKTVLLDDDIAVTRMAGGAVHDFTGTFDGQGHTLTVAYGSEDSPVSDEDKAAPFRNAESGCIIKNLHTAGTIYTSKKYAGGIIGTQYGAVRIENCRSSVTINSLTAADGTHGGIVGRNGNSTSAKLTIDGCVFDGKILSVGETATTDCAGFVGYKGNSGTVTITNSIYAPAEIEEDETEVASGSATFVRNGSAGNNCYYTRALGSTENQGKQAYSISAAGDVTLALSGEATFYSVSGITAYKNNNGLKYGDTYYAGENDEVTLTLGYTRPAGYAFTGYTAGAGTLTDNVLTMPADNVTVSAGFEQAIYTITVAPATHGTVKSIKSAAYYGEYVALLIFPERGYCIKSVAVNGNVLEENGGYWFYMPDEDVTVTAEFESATYQITVADTPNGSVSASVNTAHYKDPVTLTVQPDDGYQTVFVNVNGVAVIPENGVYSFEMPGEDVTVTAGFAEPDKCCFDSVTNTLYLSGDVNSEDVWSYKERAERILVAQGGCVLPQNSKYLFDGFSKVTSIDLTGADTSNVYIMWRLFRNCTALEEITFGSGFDTSSVTDMSEMFFGCKNLTTLDLSAFKTSRVEKMFNMFYGCESLRSVDLSSFDTGNVDDMGYMFYQCKALTELDLSSFDTRKVTYMCDMFCGCSSLTVVDISGFDTASLENADDMFNSAGQLTTIYAGKKWSIPNAASAIDMFLYCNNLKGEAGTAYTFENRSGAYARIDGGEGDPGYFTGKYCALTINDAANGTVTANVTGSVLARETVTLTVTPGEGYAVADVTVNGETIEPVNGVYSFEMPTSDAVVSASFIAIGDANRDGYIDVRDVTVIQRHLSETESIPEKYLIFADTDGDGEITINDATLLQSYLAECDVALGKHNIR